MVFVDRRDAGRQLGEALKASSLSNPIVFALPRGGVPVGFEVAGVLRAPLEVLVARKLGVPGQSELGFGAIAEGGVVALNTDLVERIGISQREIGAVVAAELTELNRRVEKYRGTSAPHSLLGATAVLVDDGLATGYTARAGLAALREMGAERVILAVPVGAPESIASIEAEGNEVICLHAPEMMMAVGQWYRDFDQTSDAEVLALLREAGREAGHEAGHEAGQEAAQEIRNSRSGAAFENEILIDAGGATLPGSLTLPAGADAVVIFAHGSGSSRKSPRNMAVARYLNSVGLGTLLFDLLRPEEAADRSNVFDIDLLAERLVAATRRLDAIEATSRLKIGYFGASTGAGAALVAAAHLGERIGAVVSRGGRPDLAGSRLSGVSAPTLLLVGGRDTEVLELNRLADEQIRCESELVVIPGATHLFEEPGALEEVESQAAAWFTGHLGSADQKTLRSPPERVVRHRPV